MTQKSKALEYQRAIEQGIGHARVDLQCALDRRKSRSKILWPVVSRRKREASRSSVTEQTRVARPLAQEIIQRRYCVIGIREKKMCDGSGVSRFDGAIAFDG